MKLALRFSMVAVVATLLTAGAVGCGSDLGDPVLRYADWDATVQDDGGGANSNNMLASWLPDCGPDYYPCPPYGTSRRDIVKNIWMVAANDAAWDLADSEGLFSLADMHQSGAKLLFIFNMWVGRLEVMTVLILFHPDLLRTLLRQLVFGRRPSRS